MHDVAVIHDVDALGECLLSSSLEREPRIACLSFIVQIPEVLTAGKHSSNPGSQSVLQDIRAMRISTAQQMVSGTVESPKSGGRQS